MYSAWLAEVDQRAAGTLAGRMPELPAGVDQDHTLMEVRILMRLPPGAPRPPAPKMNLLTPDQP